MCVLCELAGRWVCCGGIFSVSDRCGRCGCTQSEDASACALFEAMDPKRIAAGRYPTDDELIGFKTAQGFGKRERSSSG